ncbi:hypothetical protein PG993_009596 [Apiospora rasikravindrae]|uniref:Uncharacterized protein n=1 Tax=Apiospora rasikravindrae TaxID=990691 RepID=A0ABR1SJU0_9PEZI
MAETVHWSVDLLESWKDEEEDLCHPTPSWRGGGTGLGEADSERAPLASPGPRLQVATQPAAKQGAEVLSDMAPNHIIQYAPVKWAQSDCVVGCEGRIDSLQLSGFF